MYEAPFLPVDCCKLLVSSQRPKKMPPPTIMDQISDLSAPFVLGGVTVSLIKVLGNKVSPAYAAVMGGFPLGMVSSRLIDDRVKVRCWSLKALHFCKPKLCYVVLTCPSPTHDTCLISAEKNDNHNSLKNTFTITRLCCAVFSEQWRLTGMQSFK